jgi:hypothetical protein
MANNRFTRRMGGKAIFPCRACKRNTRVSSSTNGSSDLCGLCDERLMIENGICDNSYTGQDLIDAEARMEKLKQAAIKKGGVIKF